jgi:FkbM family methyltransferase
MSAGGAASAARAPRDAASEGISWGYVACRSRVLAKTFGLLLTRPSRLWRVLRAPAGHRHEVAEALALEGYAEVQRRRAGMAQPALDFRFYLRPEPAQVADHARWILAYRVWEPAITFLVRHRLRPGATVVDVGANLGYYVLLASRAVGPRGRVLGFEPEPSNLEFLKRSLTLNGVANAEVSGAALGDRDGTAVLHLSPRAPGLHSIVQPVGTESVEVPLRRLDSIPLERRIDLLLIDAEGAESLVVDGGRGRIEADRPEMVMEFTPAAWKGREATLTWLAERYRFYRIVEAPRLIRPVDPQRLLASSRTINVYLAPIALPAGATGSLSRGGDATGSDRR